MKDGIPIFRPVDSACSRVGYGPSTTRWASSLLVGGSTEAGRPAARSLSASSLAQAGFCELLTWRYTEAAALPLSALARAEEAGVTSVAASRAGRHATGSHPAAAPPSIVPVCGNP